MQKTQLKPNLPKSNYVFKMIDFKALFIGIVK